MNLRVFVVKKCVQSEVRSPSVGGAGGTRVWFFGRCFLSRKLSAKSLLSILTPQLLQNVVIVTCLVLQLFVFVVHAS